MFTVHRKFAQIRLVNNSKLLVLLVENRLAEGKLLVRALPGHHTRLPLHLLLGCFETLPHRLHHLHNCWIGVGSSGNGVWPSQVPQLTRGEGNLTRYGPVLGISYVCILLGNV